MNHTYQPTWLAALDFYRPSQFLGEIYRKSVRDPELRQWLRKVYGH